MCREAGVEGERRRTAVFGVRLKGRASGLLDPTRSFNVELRTQGRGQRGRRTTGSVKWQRRTGSPAAASGANSTPCGAELGEQELHEIPGVKAEFLRGLAGAPV